MGAADEMLWAGQTAPGLWVFEQLAAAYATSPGVIANLALVLRRLGRLAKAEATYRRALELAPDDAVVRSDLGLLLKGRGDHEAAAAAFLTALRCEGPAGTSPAGTNLGVLFQRTGKRRGRDPEADLVAVLRLRPQQSLARRLLLDGLTARARSGR
jgi:Flp pilus assembly protein TadD